MGVRQGAMEGLVEAPTGHTLQPHMRVLVTGHKGYVGPIFGRHVANRELKWDLIGADAEFFSLCLTGPDPSQYFQREIRADVRSLPDDIIKGTDAVVYLAAVSNDPMGAEFEQATMAINADAALGLARRARMLGVKNFAFASSCSVYGASGERPRTETDEVRPQTAYARSKIAAEEGLHALADDRFMITCLRFATACGASPRLRLDLVLNDFVASAVLTGRIEVLSDGSPWRPLIHVEDMARAIEWALVRGGSPFVSVNVGSREWTWQIGNLAEDVARVIGDVSVSINRSAQPDSRSYKVDFSNFEKAAPEHQPQKQFAAAVRELSDQISEMDFEQMPFRDSMFIRLNVLRALKSRKAISSDLEWVTQEVKSGLYDDAPINR